MDGLMVVSDYATEPRHRHRYREDSSPAIASGLMSPSPCRAFEDECTPLRGSPAGASSPAPVWNAAAVFNKALHALKATKQSVRFSAGVTKEGKPSTSSGVSPMSSVMRSLSTPTPAKNTTTPDIDASPTSILMTSELIPFSDECCGLSSGGCSRRSGAIRRSHGLADSPSASSTTTANDSPFSSLAASPSKTTSRGKRGSSSKSSLRLLTSATSSPLGAASPFSAAAAATPRATASSRITSGSAQAMVGQAAIASVILVRKALSTPLERAGVLSKCKEKQE